MKHGYTRIEAERLVNETFETLAAIGRVPKQTRGHVIEALDAGDHWNVLIEWELPHISTQLWYDKFDVQHSMHRVQPGGDQNATQGELETLEIRSSHDLAATSAGGRRNGPHSYQVNCREFTSVLRSWERDKAQRGGPIGLTTLKSEQIWITAAESRRVAAAIKAIRSPVALD